MIKNCLIITNSKCSIILIFKITNFRIIRCFYLLDFINLKINLIIGINLEVQPQMFLILLDLLKYDIKTIKNT